MIPISRTIATLLLVIACITATAQQSFVQTAGHRFYLDGKPYYFAGANYWYGGLLGLEKNQRRGVGRLQKELDFLQQNGVTNLRVVVGAEGAGKINGVVRIAPALQPEQGVFNESVLDGLDLLLSEMGKRNMKAVLYFSNNWEWSGGFQQYLAWNGEVPEDQKERKLNWDEHRDIVSRFYSCTPCKEAYNKQVALVLDRTNKITGKKYTDDAAIMAWELANEPRPMRPAANEAYLNWIRETAAFIKSKDKNHLLTIGSEGSMGTEGMPLFEASHAVKEIDYLTIHIWPKNWGWFKDTAIAQGFANVVAQTKDYIRQHELVAQQMNKPLVLEEFGLPRDGHVYNAGSSTTLRDRYYEMIFAQLSQSAVKNGVLAGANIWSFGGTARPVRGQVFWKKGDELMGDPPMEEQGLNSVFDNDKSTWNIVRAHAQKMASRTSNIAAIQPADPNATLETKNLLNGLYRLLDKGIMFGHQDDMAYGVNWKYQKGRSDIKDITGDFPAVQGYELGHLEIDSLVNLDSVPFDRMKEFIRTTYAKGGVATLSWHLRNPLTGKTSWDPAPGTVASILPGGQKHELYQSWLDKVAHFLSDLKGPKGETIPIIFRPFHELNGAWFWWGAAHCTPEEYKALFRFTVQYLRDVKGLHHLLYAFNTDRFNSIEAYEERYPGDEWVDVIGFDIYQRAAGPQANEQFAKDLDSMLTMLETLAQKHRKLPALTELGFGNLPDSTWFSNVFWKTVQRHRISFALAWRNAGYKPESNSTEFYVPYKGSVAAPDFSRLYQHPRSLFMKEVGKEKLYQSK
ncbi:glycosyl hydrolase [Pseudocnuella soli]|uniref:glycosyl hydrolase n=1 Tax=Pseudocnuella soli TaxID=2502779 RepID=UPI00104DDF3D|nr:glycosyl hydrolase [Pseudocnuella soli]